MWNIAQLVRAPGCGPGGRGFEPHYSTHKRKYDLVLILNVGVNVPCVNYE